MTATTTMNNTVVAETTNTNSSLTLISTKIEVSDTASCHTNSSSPSDNDSTSGRSNNNNNNNNPGYVTKDNVLGVKILEQLQELDIAIKEQEKNKVDGRKTRWIEHRKKQEELGNQPVGKRRRSGGNAKHKKENINSSLSSVDISPTKTSPLPLSPSFDNNNTISKKPQDTMKMEMSEPLISSVEPSNVLETMKQQFLQDTVQEDTAKLTNGVDDTELQSQQAEIPVEKRKNKKRDASAEKPGKSRKNTKELKKEVKRLGRPIVVSKKTKIAKTKGKTLKATQKSVSNSSKDISVSNFFTKQKTKSLRQIRKPEDDDASPDANVDVEVNTISQKKEPSGTKSSLNSLALNPRKCSLITAAAKLITAKGNNKNGAAAKTKKISNKSATKVAATEKKKLESLCQSGKGDVSDQEQQPEPVVQTKNKITSASKKYAATERSNSPALPLATAVIPTNDLEKVNGDPYGSDSDSSVAKKVGRGRRQGNKRKMPAGDNTGSGIGTSVKCSKKTSTVVAEVHNTMNGVPQSLVHSGKLNGSINTAAINGVSGRKRKATPEDNSPSSPLLLVDSTSSNTVINGNKRMMFDSGSSSMVNDCKNASATENDNQKTVDASASSDVASDSKSKKSSAEQHINQHKSNSPTSSTNAQKTQSNSENNISVKSLTQTAPVTQTSTTNCKSPMKEKTSPNTRSSHLQVEANKEKSKERTGVPNEISAKKSLITTQSKNDENTFSGPYDSPVQSPKSSPGSPGLNRKAASPIKLIRTGLRIRDPAPPSPNEESDCDNSQPKSPEPHKTKAPSTPNNKTPSPAKSLKSVSDIDEPTRTERLRQLSPRKNAAASPMQKSDNVVPELPKTSVQTPNSAITTNTNSKSAGTSTTEVPLQQIESNVSRTDSPTGSDCDNNNREDPIKFNKQTLSNKSSSDAEKLAKHVAEEKLKSNIESDKSGTAKVPRYLKQLFKDEGVQNMLKSIEEDNVANDGSALILMDTATHKLRPKRPPEHSMAISPEPEIDIMFAASAQPKRKKKSCEAVEVLHESFVMSTTERIAQNGTMLADQLSRDVLIDSSTDQHSNSGYRENSISSNSVEIEHKSDAASSKEANTSHRIQSNGDINSSKFPPTKRKVGRPLKQRPHRSKSSSPVGSIQEIDLVQGDGESLRKSRSDASERGNGTINHNSGTRAVRGTNSSQSNNGYSSFNNSSSGIGNANNSVANNGKSNSSTSLNNNGRANVSNGSSSVVANGCINGADSVGRSVKNQGCSPVRMKRSELPTSPTMASKYLYLPLLL